VFFCGLVGFSRGVVFGLGFWVFQQRFDSLSGVVNCSMFYGFVWQSLVGADVGAE